MPWWWPFKKRSKERIEVARILEEVRNIIEHMKAAAGNSDVNKYTRYAKVAKSKIDRLWNTVRAAVYLDSKELHILELIQERLRSLSDHAKRNPGYTPPEVHFSPVEEEINELLKRL